MARAHGPGHVSAPDGESLRLRGARWRKLSRVTAKGWLSLGAAAIAAGVGLGVLRLAGVIEGFSALGGAFFLAGLALVVRHFLLAAPREAATRVEGPRYVGASSFHRAILDALIAAHPAGAAEVRMVLRAQDGRYEAESATLAGRAVPPSVRKPIEALAAHLAAQNEPLDRLILEARLQNDGSWRHAIDVGREGQPR